MIRVKIKKVPKARTGYQVQGSLANDIPAMGGRDYNAYIGMPKAEVSKYISRVPRDEANLEAEGGETVFGDLNGDGMPEHKIIKGPRHAQGGVPLNLPDDTFIFSDFRGMRLKDPEILQMFGKNSKKSVSYTPAELAKQYDINKYRKILQDPNADAIDRKTAELMIKKFNVKLGMLALAQEAKKGFPQGIPVVAIPAMEAYGITEEDLVPKAISNTIEAIEKEKNTEEGEDIETLESEEQEAPEEGYENAQEMNQGQPVAQPMSEDMMQQQQMMQQPGMMAYGGMPMAQYGMMMGGYDMPFAQDGMQMPVPTRPAWATSSKPRKSHLREVMTAKEQGYYDEPWFNMGMSDESLRNYYDSFDREGNFIINQQPKGQIMAYGGVPKAEYGMAMGSGMSQNYQGRKRNMYGSGPMYPRGKGLVKAQGGIEIDATNMSDDQIQREVWNAQQKALKEWQDKNPGKDPKTSGYTEPQINVKRKDAEGNIKTSKLKSSGFIVPEGKDITDLKGFPDTPDGRAAAAQYLLIEKNLNNPNVRKEIVKNTQAIVDDPQAWMGKKSTTVDPNRKWSKVYGTIPSEQEVVNAALAHQKRNLMFVANGVDPQLFSDVGHKLDNVEKVLSEGYINPKTQKPYTRQEATDALTDLKNKGFVNVAAMSSKLGVPLDPKGKDRVLQQATMHSYAKTYKDFSDGKYNDNQDMKYDLDNFLGNVSMVHSGANDESSMYRLYGDMGAKISPLDDKYDYSNNTWYQGNSSGLTSGKFTTYGDTTAGHRYMVGQRNLVYEDIPGTPDPDCQCDDPSKANYGKYKDAEGNCSCTPPSQTTTQKCPCQKTDGTVVDVGADPNTGQCNPCEEDVSYDVPQPAEWWLQDTIKTTGAFGDLMGVKKYMPWAPKADLETPRPTFLDPTRDLAANAEQANIQTAGMAQFAGPQALSARSSSVQGQASKNAADTLSRFNNANVNLANQFEFKATDIRNQEQMLNQAAASKLYDQNTIANQQFDNAKLALRNNLRNYYGNAITNRWKTDALNQMFPQYAVSPGVGGQMYFTQGKPGGFKPEEMNTSGDYWAQRKKCEDEGAKDPDACARNAVSASKNITSSSEYDDRMNAMQNQYPGNTPGVQKGGFVYSDLFTPFLL